MRAALTLALLLVAGPAAAGPAAPAASAAYDSECGGCHTLDGHSTPNGPALNGVVWRKVASLRDFAYSAALKRTIGDWTPGRLDAYLRDTQHFAPGTSMFWVIRDKSERRAIIAYLETTK